MRILIVLMCGLGFCLASSPNNQSPFFGNCDAPIYGTTTNGADGDSTLLELDPSDGTGTTVGTIAGGGIHAGVHRVTAIDLSDYGVLYGVGENSNDDSSLIVINCQNAKVLIIGQTGIPSGQTITDLSFDTNGILWGYAHGGSSPDTVGTINLWTGEYTAVGETGIDTDSGNGLTHDSNGDLFHAGGDNVSSLNDSTGIATTIAALSFLAPGNDNPRYTGLDIDENGVIYGALNDKPGGQGGQPDNYIVTVNLLTGGMSFLTNPVLNAPDSLAGITINPDY